MSSGDCVPCLAGRRATSILLTLNRHNPEQHVVYSLDVVAGDQLQASVLRRTTSYPGAMRPHGVGCLICDSLGSRPRDVLVELASRRVTAVREACLPGYLCVVSRCHVVEPFELDDGGR